MGGWYQSHRHGAVAYGTGGIGCVRVCPWSFIGHGWLLSTLVTEEEFLLISRYLPFPPLGGEPTAVRQRRRPPGGGGPQKESLGCRRPRCPRSPPLSLPPG